MITRIGVAPRKPGMSTREFQAHWASAHADAAARLPGLQRYWQSHALLQDDEPLLPWCGFDACSDLDFPDLAVMDAAFDTPVYFDRVQPDEAILVDKSAGGNMLTRREVVFGNVTSDTGLRLWRFLRLAPGRAAADLQDALQNAPRLEGAIAQERFLPLPETVELAGRLPIFDAAETFWFATQQDALAALRSSAMRQRMAAMAGLVRGSEYLLAHVVPVTPITTLD